MDQLSLFDEPPAPAERRGELPIPEAGTVERCRSCGASIIWTRTAQNRAIPLSVATIVTRGGRRYALSHFADCPDGKDWRRT